MRSLFTYIRASGLLLAVVLLASCGRQEPASDDLYRAVDGLYDTLRAGAGRYPVIAEIDHSRLAAEAGETMPPARVLLFSDPATNTAILQQEPLAGLDLPFRVLAYAEGGAPAVIATPAEFLQRRHGLADGPALQRYAEQVAGVVGTVPGERQVAFDTAAIGKGEGMIVLESGYDFDTTVERLKEVVMQEGDTVWFSEIDYRAEAAGLGVELPPLTLLLFGAPGPGGKAMANYPRMGLDAFCQKLLVRQRADGGVEALLNDMSALAAMHYGDSALPHAVITRRMRSTLGGAIEP